MQRCAGGKIHGCPPSSSIMNRKVCMGRRSEIRKSTGDGVIRGVGSVETRL